MDIFEWISNTIDECKSKCTVCMKRCHKHIYMCEKRHLICINCYNSCKVDGFGHFCLFCLYTANVLSNVSFLKTTLLLHPEIKTACLELGGFPRNNAENIFFTGCEYCGIEHVKGALLLCLFCPDVSCCLKCYYDFMVNGNVTNTSEHWKMGHVFAIIENHKQYKAYAALKKTKVGSLIGTREYPGEHFSMTMVCSTCSKHTTNGFVCLGCPRFLLKCPKCKLECAKHTLENPKHMYAVTNSPLEMITVKANFYAVQKAVSSRSSGTSFGSPKTSESLKTSGSKFRHVCVIFLLAFLLYVGFWIIMLTINSLAGVFASVWGVISWITWIPYFIEGILRVFALVLEIMFFAAFCILVGYFVQNWSSALLYCQKFCSFCSNLFPSR